LLIPDLGATVVAVAPQEAKEVLTTALKVPVVFKNTRLESLGALLDTSVNIWISLGSGPLA
jgi:hypothetical protein